MKVLRSSRTLAWGALELPVLGTGLDWAGGAVDPPPGWALARDDTRLWFIATRRAPARLHPRARPGDFVAGLWEYDVAELFLVHPPSGRYLEFNLAPNGAWWSAEFRAPRQRDREDEFPFPEVETHADLAPDGSWLATISMPLDLLRARIGFGEGTRGNVCFIVDQPPRYLSLANLPGAEPDFHQPAAFRELEEAGWEP